MSRYRATTGELLEQIRQEAKTKDIYIKEYDLKDDLNDYSLNS